ncbi:aminoglycoside phosphotransferase family protein [Candidatus Babela massiliensis]|uniref:Aminoglycoside 3'-phosphotransferase n=1 Tax=Candidatus Babela massiliensis TaxID=673862 RepID=V6DFU6_9BACT|nr:aminoglycoside phosphotransferase family protein [Candidatus Babela massiliensis]CDK30414.1 Aminoglycoside 3'-phosphotransferase [Candidatus Babela massiliensis]
MIDIMLVKQLVSSQFPRWKDLPISPVKVSGWDNRTFHLGKHMLVRMPSAEKYAIQVDKEHLWLPELAPFLPISIPVSLGLGKPEFGYPWNWSIYGWLEGETAVSGYIDNLCDFASQLAQFLIALQSIDSYGGPLPGPHNFYRGGSLEVYDTQTRQAISILKDKIDVNLAINVWGTALSISWNKLPVWIHGDVSPGNLLVLNGKLSAVIDFGMMGVGDPACDLVIAWTFFKGESREIFRKVLQMDSGTWARGRAWALWKALIVASGLTSTNAVEAAQAWRVINEVFEEYKREIYG